MKQSALPPMSRRRRVQAGFTLIELIIVVAIVGVIARFAIPAYTLSVQKAHRTDAKQALLDLAAREERFLTINNVYSTSPSALGLAGTSFPISIPGGSSATTYSLTASVTTGPATFTLTATPTGNQAGDACGTYTLNNYGTQSVSGAASGCW